MRKMEKELKEQREMTNKAVRQELEARDRVHALESLLQSQKAAGDKLRAALVKSHEWVRRLRRDKIHLEGALRDAVRTADLAEGRATLELMPGHELVANGVTLYRNGQPDGEAPK